jgi:ubiquinone/menaquinone biosynthesis C-methylase UbiE
MKTQWDYTLLAQGYLKRPDYSITAINAMLAITGLANGKVCDVGAGAAHLTLMLANRNFDVMAIEPNDAMRANGIKRTMSFPNVSWFEGAAEKTGQGNQVFDLVTFGSSFNVCDTNRSLNETARILKPKGWFACMWNHRSLDDPIQKRIESIIKTWVPDYSYGSRRDDQTSLIESSGLFESIVHLSANLVHEQNIYECIEAWKSHATLARQSGVNFAKIIVDIEKYLIGLGVRKIKIPYSTHIWVAQLK